MTVVPDNQLAVMPDLTLMRRHLDLIVGGEARGLVEIAWTDEDQQAALRHARLFHVTDLDAAAHFAAERSATPGVNVYVGAALRREDAHRHRRAKATDVLGTRVVWFDADRDAQGALLGVMKKGAPTCANVATGGVPETRLHGYWQLSELLTDHGELTALLKAIAATLGTDPAVVDPPRVLRLAGSVAWPKKAGRVVELVGYRGAAGTTRTVSLEALKAKFPATVASASGKVADEARPPPNSEVIAGETTINDLRSALAAIPSDDRRLWVRFAHALKPLGDRGRQLWEDWSAKSMAYDPDDAERVWRSAKGERTGYAAVFAEAQRLGWKNPRALITQEPIDDAAPAVAPVRASELLTQEPTARRWLVADLIPAGQVTELRGDGGAGKSTLALQLCVSAVTGAPWLRLPVEHHGPAFYLASEDDADELRRRLFAIAEQATIDRDALGDLLVWPLATEDPALVAQGPMGVGPTARWAQLVAHVEQLRPAVIVLDSRADVFAGEEINRQQVRGFIGRLRELAIRVGAAVVVLAHPSQSGKADRTGNSGSTHWGNAVRSALYLSHVIGHDGEPHGDMRVLSVVKSNYGPGGLTLPLRWQAGVFVSEWTGAAPLSRDEERAKVDELFLILLAERNAQGRIVSDRTGPNFAPAVFAKMPRAAGVTSSGFREAMERLFEANRIAVIEVGRPSNSRKKLIAVTATQEFGILGGAHR
jgi:RecA-family ATPase